MPQAPVGTTRVTRTIDGAVYFPLVASCPAASCTNGDPIANAIPDAGTAAYKEAVARKTEKDVNIATAVVGLAGSLVRGVGALAELTPTAMVATRSAGVAEGNVATSLLSRVESFVAPNGGIVEIPSHASMSNVGVRQWYLAQEARIPELIDGTAPLEEQAYQSWQLRNTFRDAARNAMEDQSAAAALNTTRPNLTWAQTVKKYSQPNQTTSPWQQIIDASQRSNTEINESLGVFPTIKR